MLKLIQIRPLRRSYMLFSIVTSLLLLSACGGGGESVGNSSSRTGSISFSLDWQQGANQPSARQSPSDNICEDYAINDIEAVIEDSSNTRVASASWQCSEHTGTISGVPAGTGLTLTITGIVAGNPDWHNQPLKISVRTDQNTNVGTVVMSYYGADTTPPTVLWPNPSPNASDVSLNSKIVVKFSEDVIRATVQPAFTLFGTAMIAGNVEYDSSTHTATFMPDANLEYNTQYTINIAAEVQDRAGHQMAGFYTSKFTTGTLVDVDPPTIPNLLSLTAVSEHQIDLSWEAAEDNVAVTAYNIYRDGEYVKTVSTTSTTDTNLNPDTGYCYRITALDAAGWESKKSNEICEITPPPPPEPLYPPELMTPVDGAELDNNCDDYSDAIEWDFDWSDVSGATQYQIYIIGSNASIPILDDVVNSSDYYFSSNSYIADINRLGWTWKVRAGNDEGQWSDWSEEGNFNVEMVNTDCPSEIDLLPPTLIYPKDNEVMDNNCQDYSDSIDWDFEWSGVPGATQYQIYVIHSGASYPVIDTVVNNPYYYHSKSSSYISDANRFDWMWKVRSGNDANQWSDWSPERTFDAEPLNTDCP